MVHGIGFTTLGLFENGVSRNPMKFGYALLWNTPVYFLIIRTPKKYDM